MISSNPVLESKVRLAVANSFCLILDNIYHNYQTLYVLHGLRWQFTGYFSAFPGNHKCPLKHAAVISSCYRKCRSTRVSHSQVIRLLLHGIMVPITITHKRLQTLHYHCHYLSNLCSHNYWQVLLYQSCYSSE